MSLPHLVVTFHNIRQHSVPPATYTYWWREHGERIKHMFSTHHGILELSPAFSSIACDLHTYSWKSSPWGKIKELNYSTSVPLQSPASALITLG